MLDPQRLKNYIFVSGYNTTRVHGIKKKFSRTMPSPKKKYFCFCLKYYFTGLRKKINRRLTSTEKKIVSDHSTTMVNGTWRKFNQTRHSPKKKSGYIKAGLALNWHSIPTGKKYIFSCLATVLPMMHETKNQSH